MAIFVIPFIGWFSKLVDRHKKQTVLYILFTIYALICLIFALLLSHPVIGVANTQPSPYRIFGWLFSLTMDFYPTFVIGTFWAFINSISTPDFAKNSYGIIHAFVKMGSIFATSVCVYLTYRATESVTLIPLLVAFAGLLTLTSLIFISKIIKSVPAEHLVGYQGAKKQAIELTKKPVWGIFEGIKHMITKPYVFGIFFIIYCYDVIFTIVEYQAHVMLSAKTANIANRMNLYLFSSATISQVIGLFIAVLVTSRVLNKTKTKFSLLIMPISSVILVIMIFLFPCLATMLTAMTLLPAIHFSLNSPVREILFIPTIKDIQFKSKAWMDSFGRTLSKSSASTINMLFTPQSNIFILFSSSFSFVLVAAWSVVAYAMGNKYEKTVDKGDIIGG